MEKPSTASGSRPARCAARCGPGSAPSSRCSGGRAASRRCRCPRLQSEVRRRGCSAQERPRAAHRWTGRRERSRSAYRARTPTWPTGPGHTMTRRTRREAVVVPLSRVRNHSPALRARALAPASRTAAEVPARAFRKAAPARAAQAVAKAASRAGRASRALARSASATQVRAP
jgi:hypothetical protein